MKKLIMSLSLLVTALVGAAPASLHVDFRIGKTPVGEAFECEGVTTQDRMLDVLRRAGWGHEQKTPQIDWRKYEAVVVSPSFYYDDEYLTFYGLVQEGNSIVLRYGWRPIKSVEPSTPGSYTMGSSIPGYAATIVVWYRRGLDSGRRFGCRNLGVVRQ